MHMTTTHFWTAAAGALFCIISLKFLHVFKFIKWSPTGWTKRIYLFTDSPGWLQWLLLGVFCFLVFFILYLVTLFTSKIPPSLSSIVITVIALLIIEWMIHVDPDITMVQFLKKISIPFACLMAMIVRFVVGTSVYMKNTFG